MNITYNNITYLKQLHSLSSCIVLWSKIFLIQRNYVYYFFYQPKSHQNKKQKLSIISLQTIRYISWNNNTVYFLHSCVQLNIVMILSPFPTLFPNEFAVSAMNFILKFISSCITFILRYTTLFIIWLCLLHVFLDTC